MEFGPEIKVDGKRPDWLVDGVKCMVRWADNSSSGPFDSECISGWETSIEAIRLPIDHPYYATQPAVSGADGSSYYDIEINGVTVSCNDVIDALGLNFNMGNILKAAWRLGKKPGVSKEYDLDKIVYFAQREASRDA